MTPHRPDWAGRIALLLTFALAFALAALVWALASSGPVEGPGTVRYMEEPL